MPGTEVVFFMEEDGSCPITEWLDGLSEKVQNKCFERIRRLAEMGYEMKRPLAATLRDGIHELRVKAEGVQFRMLYFFDGKVAVISHGLKKESDVPEKDIELALTRKKKLAE